MALDSYTALAASLADWQDRTFTAGEVDEFIVLAEAAANRKLRQDFRRKTSATITTDASGLVTLPAGFVGMTSLVRNVLGSLPLKQVSWDSLIERNPYSDADDAQVYAIKGTQLRVSPVTSDGFLAVFSSVLTGVSDSNATNWLLALAPDFYLSKCRAAAYSKFEDEVRAGQYNGVADDILDELVGQGNVAEYGNAEMTFPQRMP